MKTTAILWSGLCLALLAGVGLAQDRTGLLGLSYTVGPNFIVGGSDARDAGAVQPGVGTALQWGVTKNADVTFSYDYVDANLRSQAITFGGQWHVAPDKFWCPIAGAGLGFGKPYSGEGWGHISLKLLGGLEKYLTPDVSLAGTIAYQYIEGPDPFGSVHAFEPGIRLTFYFDHLRR